MGTGRSISRARRKLGRLAVRCLDRVRALDGGYAQTLFERASALEAEKQLEQALSYLDRGLRLRSDDVRALCRKAAILKRLKRAAEALECLDLALALNPDCREALISRAMILRTLGRTGEALVLLRRAMELFPDDSALHTTYLFTLNFDPSADERAKQRERAEWDRRHAQKLKSQWRPHENAPAPGRRLRIGYCSSYFGHDNSTYGLAPIILNRDADRFEIFCYSDTLNEDDVTASLRKQVHHWRRTRELSDEQMAELVRADRIDILIDCLGHMKGNRLLVFARKPAPIQVTAIGEVTGTGLEAMDYLLGTRTLVPEADRGLFAERVIDLPNFSGFWSPDSLPDVVPPPALKQGFVTFGSFSRLAKIIEPTIRCWAGILRRLPTARLLLKNRQLTDPAFRNRIAGTFEKYGVSSGSVVFAGSTDRQTHFACYNMVDIALDTFPHSGGMTTLDALWMGVPVVSWPGGSVSSRWAATSLVALGLSDLLVDSEEGYVERAVAAANDLGSLAQLRAGLRPRMASSDFGDGRRFCRAVEARYLEMWARWCQSVGSREPSAAAAGQG